MRVIGFLSLLLSAGATAAAAGGCRNDAYGGADYAVCEFNSSNDSIRLFLNGEDGAPFGHFARLRDALATEDEALLFAMNAGMYRDDRSPVGHYVENRAEAARVNRRSGPGNFHLKPNGVFWISEDGEGLTGAHISTTDDYFAGAPHMRDATQSGPMLVIDGDIHPRFLIDSISKKRRNGVGVDGERVVFALADTPVTLHEFAAYFRDRMRTPNALYLDGTISRLYAPELGRDDPGAAMGPIVGVVAPAAANADQAGEMR